MSDTITIHVNIGIKPLEMYKEQVKAKLPNIVKKNALAIQAGAAAAAPVDTGTLKNSIMAEEGDKGDPLHWEIHDGVEYGVYQELGEPPRAKRPHFLGNACEKQADKFFDEIREALRG